MSLLQERSRLVNRVQKVLEDANIKLTSVVTDIMGMTGHAIVTALVKGEVDPERLAHLARGSLIKKQDQLKAALQGKLTPHQRVLLEELLQLIATLNRTIARLDREIADRLGPHDALISRIDEVTGLSRRSIEVLLGELGWDMSHFPDAAHAASWVGICPGNHETGGKRLNGRIQEAQSLGQNGARAGSACSGPHAELSGRTIPSDQCATRSQESCRCRWSQYSGDFRVIWSRPVKLIRKKERITFSPSRKRRFNNGWFDNWNV